jgi:hypothetical protein
MVAFTRAAVAHRAAADLAEARGDFARALQHREFAAEDDACAAILVVTEE